MFYQNDTYDLGVSGNVWVNIYTGDLNLSNMNKEQGNDIDGTWKLDYSRGWRKLIPN